MSEPPTPATVASHKANNSRSKGSVFDLTWTILDLQRRPPTTRCCYTCNPGLAAQFSTISPQDPRLYAYANEFKYPLAEAPSRPLSSASTSSNTSTSSRTGKIAVSASDKANLQRALTVWRATKHERSGSLTYTSAQIYFPPKQLNAFVTQAQKLVSARTISPQLLRKLVPWDGATDFDIQEIADIISDWSYGVRISVGPSTPTSQRRASKRVRTSNQEPPPPQPQFQRLTALPPPELATPAPPTTPRMSLPMSTPLATPYPLYSSPLATSNPLATPQFSYRTSQPYTPSIHSSNPYHYIQTPPPYYSPYYYPVYPTPPTSESRQPPVTQMRYLFQPQWQPPP